MPFTRVLDPSANPGYVPPPLESSFVRARDTASFYGVATEINPPSQYIGPGVNVGAPPAFSPIRHLQVATYPIAGGSFQAGPSASSASQQPQDPYFMEFPDSPVDNYHS